MKRNSLLHRIYQNAVPPFLRDNRYLFRFLLSTQSVHREIIDLICDFHEKLPYISDDELSAYYEKLSLLQPQTTETSCVGADCTQYIVDYAKEHPEMMTYLDCACGGGGGGVTNKLAELGRQVVGMDFVISETLKDSSNATFVKGDIRHIPYKDKSFDVVVSAHTLEHVIRIQDAIAELRRVAKHTLIIIVPCQREFRYTFDLHVHFFPYKETFHRIMENPDADCFYLDHDIVYIENKK